MKTKSLFIILLFFGLNQSLFSQSSGLHKSGFDTSYYNNSHHVAFQAGTGSLPQVLSAFGEGLSSILSFSDRRYTNKRNSGALFLQYQYALHKQIRLGVTAGLDYQSGDIETLVSTDYVKRATYYNQTYSVALEAMFIYNQHDLVKIYGKLGLGMSRFEQRVDNIAPTVLDETAIIHYPTGQLTPIGLEIGKTMSGFAEFGFGYNGIISFGLRGKF